MSVMRPRKETVGRTEMGSRLRGRQLKEKPGGAHEARQRADPHERKTVCVRLQWSRRRRGNSANDLANLQLADRGW